MLYSNPPILGTGTAGEHLVGSAGTLDVCLGPGTARQRERQERTVEQTERFRPTQGLPEPREGHKGAPQFKQPDDNVVAQCPGLAAKLRGR